MPLPETPLNGTLGGKSPSKMENMQRTMDSMRKHIAKLKSELELEKAKSKQVHRDKIVELKQAKETFDQEKEHAIETAHFKFQADKQAELDKYKESINREKDIELRQVLKYKDEEIKQLKSQFSLDKEETVRSIVESDRRSMAEHKEKTYQETIQRLRNDLRIAKEGKKSAEEEYQRTYDADTKKAAELKRIRQDHDLELQKVLREARKETIREQQHLKSLERVLNAKSAELTEKEFFAKKLELEKEELGERLHTIQRSRSNSINERKTPKTSTPNSKSNSHTGSEERLDLVGVRGINPKELGRRLFEEKDKSLQKKVSELTTYTHRLEKKLSGLRAENESLKRKHDDVKPADEKIRKLKKRNAELAAIARRLEEKAKQLQQENLRRATADPSSPAQDADHVKKVFARQRAKDLAENAKTVLAKDKEIDELRKRCHVLGETLNNSTLNSTFTVQNSTIRTEDHEELESIIKQAAKERLSLERQIAHNASPLNSAQIGDLSNLQSLEESNKTLLGELEHAQLSVKTVQKLEVELVQEKIRIESLEEKLAECKSRITDLEEDIGNSNNKNTQLLLENSQLQLLVNDQNKKLSEPKLSIAQHTKLQALEETNKTLKKELDKAQRDAVRMNTLEESNRVLKHKNDKLVKSEKDYKTLVTSLEDDKVSLETDLQLMKLKLQETESLKFELDDKISEIESLQKEIEEERTKSTQLESDIDTERERNTQLTKQNTELQHRNSQLEKNQEELARLNITLSEITLESEQAKQEVTCLQKKIDEQEILTKQMQQTIDEQVTVKDENDKIKKTLKQKEDHLNKLQYENKDIQDKSQTTIEKLKMQIQELEKQYKQQSEKQEEIFSELESIRKKQLERLTSSVHVQTDNNTSSAFSEYRSGHSEVSPVKSLRKPRHSQDLSSSWEHISLDKMDSLDSSKHVHDLTEVSELDGDLSGHSDVDTELADIAAKIKALSVEDSDNDDDDNIANEKDEEVEGEMLQSVDVTITETDAAPTDTSIVPEVIQKIEHAKSSMQVYVAKYSYDPNQLSPNDNPEAELYLNAGDYIYVLGDMDEDGFYEGELMDGRRGLVPSNFVEKVTEEEMDDFQTALEMQQSDHDSTVDSLQHELEFNSSDESEKMMNIESYDDYRRINNKSLEYSSDLEDIEEVDEENLTMASDASSVHDVAAPRKLTLDRELSEGVIVSWVAPDCSLVKPQEIQAYHVIVDGLFKTSVKATERTKALVENIKADHNHRISVRTICTRGQSRDAECTITIGRDAKPAPHDLKMSHITTTSANLSWYPSNSNFQHIVYVNGVESRMLKPGVHKLSLTGLKPSREYMASVCAKALKPRPTSDEEDDDGNIINDKNKTSTTSFKTLPEGLPDPPLNVQVEADHIKGSLSVSWLPVTINPLGTSNGALVKGYAIYIDGSQVKVVDNPTGDHLVLNAVDIPPHSKKLTIKTLADKKTSPDSVEVNIPVVLQQTVAKSSAKSIALEAAEKVKERNQRLEAETQQTPESSEKQYVDTESGSDSELIEMFKTSTSSDVQPKSPRTDAASIVQPEVVCNTLPQHGIESSSDSELSDIEEVEEEDLSEFDTVDLPGLETKEFLPNKLPTFTAKAFNVNKEMSPIQPPSHSKVTQPTFTSTPKLEEAKYKADDKKRMQKDVFIAAPITVSHSIPEIEITRDSDHYTDDDFESYTSSKENSANSLSNIVYEPSHKRTTKSESPRHTVLENLDQHKQKIENGKGKRLHHANEGHIQIGRKDRDTANHEDATTTDQGSSKKYDSASPRKDKIKTDNKTRSHSGDRRTDKDSSLQNREKTGKRESSVLAETISPREELILSNSTHSVRSNSGDSDDLRKSRDREYNEKHASKSKHGERRSRSSDSNDIRKERSKESEHDGKHVSRSKRSEKRSNSIDSADDIRKSKSREQSSEKPELHEQVLSSPTSRESNKKKSHTPPDKARLSDKVSINVISSDSDNTRKHRHQARTDSSRESLGSNLSRGSVTSETDCSMLNELASTDPVLAERRNHRDSFSPGEAVSISDVFDASSEVNGSEARLFIALFDYDPASMSPNPDTFNEELPFTEGDIIKIYGSPDDDGFYMGEVNGNRGYVPCNMVSEIPTDEADVTEQLLKQSNESPRKDVSQPDSYRNQDFAGNNGYPTFEVEGPSRQMVALYDYDPKELSPNVDAEEVEIPFKTGELMLVYGVMDEDGFYVAELRGRRGLVPSNFLQDMTSLDDEDDDNGESSTPSRNGSATSSGKKGKKVISKTIKKDKKKERRDDGKDKKKKGFLAKGKDIFKKFSR